MTEVNGKGGFFQRAGEFPAYKDQSFPLSSDAARYYKSGPPFLQRYLPFWLAVLVERLFVMILPLVMVLLPLLKFAPAIYSWRVRSKIVRCYGDLKFLENDLRQHYDPARIRSTWPPLSASRTQPAHSIFHWPSAICFTLCASTSTWFVRSFTGSPRP
jgi:hypothetical protein